MKHFIFQKSIIVTGLLFFSTCLNAKGANEENFNEKHSAANQSFIETMAKNRAHSNIGNASVTEVRGKEEFKEALKNGDLNQQTDTNKITKEYKHIEVKDVRLNKNDLKEIEGDQLLIGSQVDDQRQKLMQNIEIKNSKIETDKKLNVGVVSSNDEVSGITSVNKIDRSSLQGGNNKNQTSKSRLELMRELEEAN